MPIPLTLIVPVYNRQAKLDRALRSVLDQQAHPREIIIVDDGSTVPAHILPELRERLNIRLLRREKNGGAAAARNTAMMEAETDWVAFLDSDDTWLPSSLDRRWTMVKERQAASPDPKAIYGCSWIDCADDRSLLATRHPRSSSDPLDFAGGCWFSPGSCIIINCRHALKEVGPQDETLRRFEDFDWFLALALKGFRLEVLPVVGAEIEIRRQQDPRHIEETAQLLRRKWGSKVADPALLRRIQSYIDLEVAAAWYYRGPRHRVIWPLARSLLRFPRLSLHTSPGWVIEKPRTA